MQFSNEVIKVLDELGKKFGVAIDWTQQNITPYVQDLGHRIVRYDIIRSSTWIVIFVIIAILGLIVAKLDKKVEDSEGLLLCLGIGMIVIASIFIITNTFHIIKAVNVPEMIWVDYVKDMIK